MSHGCHAFKCETDVPPRLHMCGRHWRLVPKALQDNLWANYRPRQERDKQPSVGYLKAAAACVEAVAIKEGYTAVDYQDEVDLYLTWAEMLEEDA